MILAFYSEACGTGKDSAATFAAQHLASRGYGVERDAFGWDGKVVCADALGIEGTRMEKVAAIDRLKLNGEVWFDVDKGDRVGRCKAVTGRDFIIGLLGSPDKGNGIRGLDEKFWTRQVIDRAYRTDAWTVVSDLRFLEQASSVESAGGAIVEIVRDEGSLGTFNEQRLSPALINHTIHNVGTLDDLRYAVEIYLDQLIYTHPPTIG